MASERLAEVLKAEALHAEANKDAPLQDGTIITHRGVRSHVFSIRLSDAERDLLEQCAGQVGVAPSTLARQWIAERLISHTPPTDLEDIANTLATLAKTVRSLQ